jgi:hypothetical protein
VQVRGLRKILKRFEVVGVGPGALEVGDGEAEVCQHHGSKVGFSLFAGKVSEGGGDTLQA